MKHWHSLDDKQVWVLGGAGYLGSAITEALDASCAKTLCFDLGERAADFVRTRQLTKTIPVALDTSRVEKIESALQNLMDEHGVPDGLVNLTYASSSGQALEELTAKDFQTPFDLSVASYFLASRVVADRMKASRGGSIVLFASMYGMVAPDPSIYAAPFKTNPIDYGASKAAILQMARYLAMHYGPDKVRVNCVTPGSFPNPQILENHPEFVERLKQKAPMKRVGHNSEIVGPTLFLLGDGASFMTGQSLVVDGGWTIW